MLDVSKETNVAFLRAATKHCQEKILFLEKELAQARALNKRDEELCQKLSEELLNLKKMFFKGGSERKAGSAPKKNKRRKSQAELLVHNQRPLGELPDPLGELASEDVIHTLATSTTEDGAKAACSCGCGELLPMDGAFEEATEIHVTERKYVLRRHKRQKYKCCACSKIVAAPLPPKLKESADYGIDMAVQVVDDKYHRHIPLNRQAEMMAERGLSVDTKTLFSLTEHLMALLVTVPPRILAEIKRQPHVHLDESPMPILYPSQSGYVWSISNAVGVYYQYETTRSGAVAKEMLKAYAGIVMTDAYSGYDFLEKLAAINFVLCWAHVRRRFFDAMDHYPAAEQVVDLIDQLYDLDRKAHDFESLAHIRARESKPVVAAIAAWMADQKGKYLESLTVGKAIFYATEHWPRLTRFLENAHIPLDNNAGERCQRQPVMGRNNFNGFRTINGADVGMFFYTLIGSCKLITLNPKAYLSEMGLRAAQGKTVLTPYEYGQEIPERVKAGESYRQIYAALTQ